MRKTRVLSETKASDVMVAPAAYVEVETPLREIARLLLRRKINAVAVVDEAGCLAGIVTEGDLVRRNTKGDEARRSWWLDVFDTHTTHREAFLTYLERHGLRAKDIMTTDVVSVTEDAGIVEVAKLLESQRVKQIPVVRGKRLVGLVPRTNLLRALMGAPPMRHRVRTLGVARANCESSRKRDPVHRPQSGHRRSFS